MCHFVLLGLKENSDEKVLRHFLNESERPLRRSDMITFDGSWKFFTATQLCDCGTAVGAAHRQCEEADTLSKADEWIKSNNFEVIGHDLWSDGSVRKAVLHEQIKRDELEDGMEELALWVNAIRSALQEGLPEIGIVIHWNESPMSTKVAVHEKISIHNFDESTVYELQENALLEVMRDTV